jgi:uncharacterized protein
MSNFLEKSGYNSEDEYIHLAEVEKIRHLREQRELLKKEQDKLVHWMKCPKCGSDMNEIELENVRIDKCSSCEGLYFDKGELDLLVNRKESHSFFSSLTGLWK